MSILFNDKSSDVLFPQRDSVSSAIRVVDSFSWRSHYSGSDLSVSFEGIPVSEMVGISYKIVEPVKFHYGYNSYTRLHSSRGSRMVHGSFILNFTDSVGIQNILTKIEKGNTPAVKGQASSTRLAALISSLPNNSIVDSLKRQYNGQSLPGNLYSDVPSKELLEKYRDSIWGIETLTNQNIRGYNYKTQTEINEPIYYSKVKGFQITLVFGEPGSDNVVFPGQSTSVDSSSRRQIGSVKKIYGVEIISENMEITETGETTRAIYEFVAKDVS